MYIFDQVGLRLPQIRVSVKIDYPELHTFKFHGKYPLQVNIYFTQAMHIRKSLFYRVFGMVPLQS